MTSYLVIFWLIPDFDVAPFAARAIEEEQLHRRRRDCDIVRAERRSAEQTTQLRREGLHHLLVLWLVHVVDVLPAVEHARSVARVAVVQI